MEIILNHYHTLACGGHIGGNRTATRYFNQDSIGPPYSKMHTSLCPLVTNTKE